MSWEQTQKPRTERWRRGPAMLTALTLGGTLAGYVALLPMVFDDELSRNLMPWLIYLVLVLTGVFFAVAWFGGKAAQRLHVEHLRLEVVRRRRWLKYWASVMLTAEQGLGAVRAMQEMKQPLGEGGERLRRNGRRWRKFRRWFGANWIETHWLRFQRVRNDYFAEVRRPAQPVRETAGIEAIGEQFHEIGRLGYYEVTYSAHSERGTPGAAELQSVCVAKINVLIAGLRLDPLARFLLEATSGARLDDADDPLFTSFGDSIKAMFQSDDFWDEMDRKTFNPSADTERGE